MIYWLQNKTRKSSKVFALVLFLFCSQLQITSHLHADTEISYETCSVCLVGQNAEFDDAVIPTQTVIQFAVNHKTNYSDFLTRFIFDKSPVILKVRGPPA